MSLKAHLCLSFFLLIMISAMIFAQSSFTGANLTGFKANDNNQLPIQLGVDGWWRADKGVVLNGTNVQVWVDSSGNNWRLRNYNPTNAPAWTSGNYTNSTIPSLNFSVGPTRFMRCNEFATAYSGEDVPFTTVYFGTAFTNSPSVYAYGFGWTGATNGGASIIGMTPGRAGTTASGINHASNTNSVAANATIFLNSGINTGQLRMVTVTYSGTSGRCFINLAAQTNQALDQTALTLNTFMIGAIGLTNGNINGGWTGNLTEIQHYRSELSGTQVTNIFQDLTNRWYGVKQL
jgi:hypothetical protein